MPAAPTESGRSASSGVTARATENSSAKRQARVATPVPIGGAFGTGTATGSAAAASAEAASAGSGGGGGGSAPCARSSTERSQAAWPCSAIIASRHWSLTLVRSIETRSPDPLWSIRTFWLPTRPTSIITSRATMIAIGTATNQVSFSPRVARLPPLPSSWTAGARDGFSSA